MRREECSKGEIRFNIDLIIYKEANFMREVNKDLWTKASMVASGINKFIWAHTCFYIYPHIDEDLKEYNVYLNNYGKFSVRLDDGSEFFLIQPCLHLIYQLYETKVKADNGNTLDDNTVIKVKPMKNLKVSLSLW